MGCDPVAGVRSCRADQIASAGQVLSVAGPVTVAAGVTLLAMSNGRADPSGTDPGQGLFEVGVGITSVGAVATLAGPPLLAAGTMRARRLLHLEGLSVSPALGWATWGLYAGDLALIGAGFAADWVAPDVWIAVYVADVVTGSVFRHQLRRRRGEVVVVPRAGGVALVGSF